MRSVFSRFIETFETDRRWLRKVTAAGAFGLAMVVLVLLRERGNVSLREAITMLIMFPACFIAAGCLLATKDSVQEKLRLGHEVGPVSRIFFSGRGWSLLLWFGLLLAFGFPLAVWIGSLML